VNIFFRALLVLVFIGVTIFAFARQFGGEKWRDSEEGGRSWPPSKATLWTGVKWIGVPGLIVALFFLMGYVIIEFDALDEQRARQEALKTRSRALEAVYNLENGQDIPSDIYKYHEENDVGAIVPPYYGEGFPDWSEDVKIEPDDVITVKASLTGDAWKSNCGEYSPMARLTIHTPGGTLVGGNRYIAFFDEGNLEVEVKTPMGGRLEFNVGCPTKTRWLGLDYEVESFMVNWEEKI